MLTPFTLATTIFLTKWVEWTGEINYSYSPYFLCLDNNTRLMVKMLNYNLIDKIPIRYRLVGGEDSNYVESVQRG